MGNIDNLREMLDAANEGTSKELKRRKVAREKAVNKLEAERSKESASLNAKYDKRVQKVESDYEEKRTAVHGIYSRRASKLVLKQLREDRTIMQRRSDLIDVLEHDGERGIALRKLLGEIDTTEGKSNIMRAFLKATGEESVEYDDLNEPQDVVSYIAEFKDRCVLVIPVNGSESKGLTIGLEKKVDDVLGQGKVLGPQDSYSFTSDIDEHSSNFVVYTIQKESVSGEDYKGGLADALIDKLSKLQPDNFSEVGLTHRVMKLDNDALDYFLNHEEDEMYSPIDALAEYESAGEKYISVAETSRVLGIAQRVINRFVTQGHLKCKDNKGVSLSSIRKYLSGRTRQPVKRTKRGKKKSLKSKLHYNASDIKGRRSEALSRINGVDGVYLDTEQLAFVLGMKWPYEILHKMRKRRGSKISRIPGEETGRTSYRVPKDEVKLYIQQHEPSGRGWRKPKK